MMDAAKSSNTVLQRALIPLLLFPLLSAAACKLIFGNQFSSGLAHSIASQCSSNGSPYMVSFTGLRSVDSGICILVFFFQEAASNPLSLSFLAYFIGTGAPLVAIPVFNSYRVPISRFIAYPVIWGLLTQTATLGVIMPMYWLAVILTGGFREHTKNSRMTEAQAQAAIFGIIIGAVIPSVGMLILDDPYVTAIWQLYPVYVSTAQHCHLFIRDGNQKSGSFTVQVAYIALFMISSSTHISIVWPILFDTTALQAMFLPSITPVTSIDGMSMQILDFLKWDFVFSFGSTILATLWISSSRLQLCALCIWYAVMIPVIGPGSAILGTLLWYEFGKVSNEVQSQ